MVSPGAFAESLLTNDTLISLNLGYTGVNDIGAQELARALQQGATLTSLTLYGNTLTSKGASHHLPNPLEPAHTANTA